MLLLSMVLVLRWRCFLTRVVHGVQWLFTADIILHGSGGFIRLRIIVGEALETLSVSGRRSLSNHAVAHLSIMPVVYRPPHSQKLTVDSRVVPVVSAKRPRLVRADEMHCSNTTGKVPVGGDVLVVATRGAVVDEAQPVPLAEMHVEKPLVGPIETDTALCQSI